MTNNTHEETRNATQIKSFTKWVNNQLEKKGYPTIESVVRDFSDGKSLLNLLDVIYCEIIPCNEGRLSSFQKRDNIDRAIRFIESKRINLVNVDADLIFNQNVKLTLGMTWALILRSIAKYTNEDPDMRNFKEILLKWCQNCTKNYKNVQIRDFTTSWKNGLAFNAILHNFAPNHIDYENLSSQNAKENLESAFDIAEKNFEITKLLDPEDLTESPIPDEKSVITYLSQYYLKLEGLDFKSQLEKGQDYMKSMQNFVENGVGQYDKKANDLLRISEEKMRLEQRLLSIFTEYSEFEQKNQIEEKIVDLSTLYGKLKSAFPLFKHQEFEVSESYRPGTIYKKVTDHTVETEKMLRITMEEIEKSSNKRGEEVLGTHIQNLTKKIDPENFRKDTFIEQMTEGFLKTAYTEKNQFIDALRDHKKYANYRMETAIKLFKTYDPRNSKFINENNFKNCCFVLNIPEMIVDEKISFDEYLKFVDEEFMKQEFNSLKVEND